MRSSVIGGSFREQGGEGPALACAERIPVEGLVLLTACSGETGEVDAELCG